MSVVLPAPFSPSRPSTLPRSAAMEILSLARTPGNRFVMSRSSRRICTSTAEARPGSAGTGRVRERLGYWQPRPRKVQTLTLPSAIAACSVCSSALVSAGIWLSKSWNGARRTPWLASVPE